MEELCGAMAGRAKALVGADASLALVGPLGELLWSSMNDDEGSFVSNVVRKLSGVLGRGDYYVGGLGERKVVVVKATDRVCLALAASAKEGVILFALRLLINAFSNELVELDAKLAEEAVKTELEVYPIEVFDPSSGKEVKVVPADAVPYVPEDMGPKAVRLDGRSIALMRATDGKTIADMARELGMDVREACEVVAELIEGRVLKARVVEEFKSDYDAVFVPKVRIESTELMAREDLRPFEKFILMNLVRGLTVLELSWGLRGLGFDVKPDEVLSLLKEMEEAGLVEKSS